MGIAVESTIAHNVTRSVYFHDPDGNRVELYCDMFDGGFAEMQTPGRAATTWTSPPARCSDAELRRDG